MIRGEVNLKDINREIYVYDSDIEIGNSNREENYSLGYVSGEKKIFDKGNSAKLFFIKYFGEELYRIVTSSAKKQLDWFNKNIKEYRNYYINKYKDIDVIDKLKLNILNKININKKGYILVTGSPKTGKTTFAVNLFKYNSKSSFYKSDIKFVNIFIDKNNKSLNPIKFLELIYEQLAFIYKFLDVDRLFEEATINKKDENELMKKQSKIVYMLKQISVRENFRNNNKKLIIIIDGLNEAFNTYSKYIDKYNIIEYIPIKDIYGIFFLLITRPMLNRKYKNIVSCIKNRGLMIEEININNLTRKSIETEELFNNYIHEILTFAEEINIKDESKVLLGLFAVLREKIAFNILHKITRYNRAIIERFLFISEGYLITEYDKVNKVGFFKLYSPHFKSYIIKVFKEESENAHILIVDYYLKVLEDEYRISSELDNFGIHNLLYHLYKVNPNSLNIFLDEYNSENKKNKGFKFFREFKNKVKTNDSLNGLPEDVINNIRQNICGDV